MKAVGSGGEILKSLKVKGTLMKREDTELLDKVASMKATLTLHFPKDSDQKLEAVKREVLLVFSLISKLHRSCKRVRGNLNWKPQARSKEKVFSEVGTHRPQRYIGRGREKSESSANVLRMLRGA